MRNETHKVDRQRKSETQSGEEVVMTEQKKLNDNFERG